MRRLLSSITLALALLTGPMALTTVPAYADTESKTAACEGIGLTTTSDGACGESTGESFSKIISTIVSLLSVVVGIAAVVMIIVSGFKYVTSGGDSNKLSSAKTALIYAIVGLVIVALAQFIVHFVLANV